MRNMPGKHGTCESVSRKDDIMSLMVYRCKSDVPENEKVITDNETYFLDNTVPLLDERVNDIIRDIDGGTYFDKGRWIDRFGTALYWNSLSTGGKTALNIFYNPDIIFSTIECGENAHAAITMLGRGKAYQLYVHRNDGSDACDIVDTYGNHFTSIAKFEEAYYD